MEGHLKTPHIIGHIECCIVRSRKSGHTAGVLSKFKGKFLRFIILVSLYLSSYFLYFNQGNYESNRANNRVDNFADRNYFDSANSD